MELQVSDGVRIDAQLVMTGRGCIIGQSGSGKSFLMGLIAEQLLSLGLPFCIIDTEGEYVSLKNGSQSVLVVGGEEGDLGEDVDFGKLFSTSISNSVPIVFDVSGSLDRTNAVYSALGALYATEEKTRTPYLVLIEEADKFAPQVVRQKINIIEELSVRGRKRGIGLIVATQRPSSISKNVLSQCSYGFIGKLTIENDLSAISQLFSDRGALDEIVNLHTGEFMSFGIDYKQRFEVRNRSSLHMGTTPVVTAGRKASASIASIVSQLKGSEAAADRQQKRAPPRDAHRPGVLAEALPFMFSERQARAYAEKASRKMFGIFGRRVESPDSISQTYMRASLCTIRMPTGKRREFDERRVLIDDSMQLISITDRVRIKKLWFSPARLTPADETLLKRIKSKKRVTKDALAKESSQGTAGLWRSLRKLAASRLITTSNNAIRSEDYSGFYLKDIPETSESKVSDDRVSGGTLSKDGAEMLLKNIYPTSSLVAQSQILIPMYTITLRNRNKVRVFEIDGLYGRELLYL